MSHPIDFQGKIKQENKPILHLSQVSNTAGCAPQNSASDTFCCRTQNFLLGLQMKKPGMMAYACTLNFLGNWGKKIAWS